MRTVEEIDKDIAQAECSIGFYVQYAQAGEGAIQTMLSELQRAREEQRRIEVLREEKSTVSKEDARKSNISFGYFLVVLGLVVIGAGGAVISWALSPDRVPGGCVFIAFGIFAAVIGFGAAQRAHARKPAAK